MVLFFHKKKLSNSKRTRFVPFISGVLTLSLLFLYFESRGRVFLGSSERIHQNICDASTSIVLATSFVPISPSIDMINTTYRSFRHIKGLCPDAPIIVVVDNLRPSDIRNNHNATKRMRQYIHNLQSLFHESNQRVIVSEHHRGIGGCAKLGMDHVETEFVYYIQHDLVFVQDIDHLAVIQTMREFPELLRIVRFNEKSTIMRPTERNFSCYNQSTTLGHAHGISFVRTPLWSDRTHLTTSAYYHSIFEMFKNMGEGMPESMEFVMNRLSQRNCTEWGPFYYGKYGSNRTIVHLHGRESEVFDPSEFGIED